MIKVLAGPAMKRSVIDRFIGVVKGMFQDLDTMLITQRLTTMMTHSIDL
jgi:hypothetical protein